MAREIVKDMEDMVGDKRKEPQPYPYYTVKGIPQLLLAFS